MNFRGYFKNELVQCGMFDDDAAEVIEQAEGDEEFKEFVGRWHDGPDDYPPIITRLMWMSIKKVAIKWIDANKPLAWYRPMFD